MRETVLHKDELRFICQRDSPNMHGLLTKFFNLLEDDRAVRIIKMRYGLENGAGCTLAKIGRHYGITREWVRQIIQRQLRKLHRSNMGDMIREMSKPLIQIFESNGGVMKEADIVSKLSQLVQLENYHATGVTSFVLSLVNEIIPMRDRIWALKNIPIAEIEYIRVKAVQVVSENLTKMSLKELVTRIIGIPKITKRGASFVEACVRTCSRLHITHDGWCMLPRWQNSYIDDLVEILRREGHPMHYKQIAAEVNARFAPVTSISTISEHSIHNRMLDLKNIFVLVKPCTFGLIEWLS